MDSPLLVITALAGFLMLLVAVFMILQPWLLCFLAKTPIPVSRILAMRTRGVNVSEVVMAFITCRKAGIETSIDEIESLYLASPKDFLPDVQRLISDRIANTEMAQEAGTLNEGHRAPRNNS